MVTGVNNQSSSVSLQQFVQENPGAEGLAQVLKSKGMQDSEVVALLQKGKDDWLSGSIPKLPPPDAGKIGGLGNIDAAMGEGKVMTDIFAFMALFQQMAQQQRNTARELRHSEMEAQVSALTEAANKIREAAEQRFQAAIVSGAMQIGAGALQVGAGAYSLKTMAGAQKSAATEVKNSQMEVKAKDLAPKDLKDVKTAEAHQAKMNEILAKGQASADKIINQASAKATNIGSMGQGAGSMLQGIGTMVSASMEKKAAEADAQKAEFDIKAKVHDQNFQQANDMMQQMQDIIRDIRDKFQAIQQSQIETTRGIARNI